jgi:hypothetical protein
MSHGEGDEAPSKFQLRQPPHALTAFKVHAHVPEPQVWLEAHALVQLPQWVLSFPFTLIQPPLPQSLVPAGQPHMPFEQVLPPVQSVPLVH